MEFNKDKIVFEALQKVLRHTEYAHIGEAFLLCGDELQKIFLSLTKLQQAAVEGYVHALSDVYVAALTVCTEESHTQEVMLR